MEKMRQERGSPSESWKVKADSDPDLPQLRKAKGTHGTKHKNRGEGQQARKLEGTWGDLISPNQMIRGLWDWKKYKPTPRWFGSPER